MVRPQGGLNSKRGSEEKINQLIVWPFCLAGAASRGKKSPSVSVCSQWDKLCATGAMEKLPPLVPKEYIIIETKEKKGLSCFKLPSMPQRRKAFWLAKRDKHSPEWGNCMDLSSKRKVAGGWVAAAEKEPCFCMPHSSAVRFIT